MLVNKKWIQATIPRWKVAEKLNELGINQGDFIVLETSLDTVELIYIIETD